MTGSRPNSKRPHTPHTPRRGGDEKANTHTLTTRSAAARARPARRRLRRSGGTSSCCAAAACAATTFALLARFTLFSPLLFSTQVARNASRGTAWRSKPSLTTACDHTVRSTTSHQPVIILLPAAAQASEASGRDKRDKFRSAVLGRFPRVAADLRLGRDRGPHHRRYRTDGSNRSSSSSKRVWPSSAVSGCVDWGGFFFGGCCGGGGGGRLHLVFGWARRRASGAADVMSWPGRPWDGGSGAAARRGGGGAAPFVFATPCLQIWMAGSGAARTRASSAWAPRGCGSLRLACVPPRRV